jgi:small GTP-binding protein
MAEEDVLRYKVKVCLLGDEGVGKSSLIKRFVVDQFSDDYVPTLGTKITKHTVQLHQDGKDYEIILLIFDINGHWSTLGQTIEDFTNMIPANFYSNAEGLLLVSDLTSRASFMNYEFWQDNLLRSLDKDVPCIFLGNKSDLKDEIKVTKEDIEDLKEEKKAPFLYTSAKTGENVEEAFKTLALTILDNLLKA